MSIFMVRAFPSDCLSGLLITWYLTRAISNYEKPLLDENSGNPEYCKISPCKNISWFEVIVKLPHRFQTLCWALWSKHIRNPQPIQRKRNRWKKSAEMNAWFVAKIESDEDHNTRENVEAVDNWVHHVVSRVLEAVVLVAVELVHAFWGRSFGRKPDCKH